MLEGLVRSGIDHSDAEAFLQSIPMEPLIHPSITIRPSSSTTPATLSREDSERIKQAVRQQQSTKAEPTKQG